jgi:hypothetical protein
VTDQTDEEAGKDYGEEWLPRKEKDPEDDAEGASVHNRRSHHQRFQSVPPFQHFGRHTDYPHYHPSPHLGRTERNRCIALPGGCVESALDLISPKAGHVGQGCRELFWMSYCENSLGDKLNVHLTLDYW